MLLVTKRRLSSSLFRLLNETPYIRNNIPEVTFKLPLTVSQIWIYIYIQLPDSNRVLIVSLWEMVCSLSAYRPASLDYEIDREIEGFARGS